MFYISDYYNSQVFTIKDSNTDEVVKNISDNDFVLGKYCNTLDVIPKEYVELVEYCGKKVLKAKLSDFSVAIDINDERYLDVSDEVLAFIKSKGYDSKNPVITNHGFGNLVSDDYVKCIFSNGSSMLVTIGEEITGKYYYNLDTKRICFEVLCNNKSGFYDIVTFRNIRYMEQ